MALKIKDMANVAGFAVAACSVVGGPVAIGGGLLAALAGSAVLLDCVKGNKKGELQSSIDTVQKSTAEEVAQIALVHDVSQEELDEVSDALNDAVYHTGVSHDDFARWNYDPTIVAERMLERLCHENDLFKTSEFARELAKGVVFKAFTTVRETECFQKQADIYFKVEVLTNLETLDATTKDTNAEVHKIRKLIEAMGDNTPRIEDASANASIDETIRSLITAQEGARKRAGDKLEANPPDPQGAKIELLQLAAQQEDNVRDAAQTYMDIGNIAYMNDTHEALEAYIRVTELTPDNPEAWNRVGHLQKRLGELAASEIAFNQVMSIGKAREDKIVLAVAAGNLGILEGMRGNFGAAAGYFEQSLKIEKLLGRKEGMASDYGNLGVVEKNRGNLDAAVEYYQQALEINKQLGSKEGMANGFGNLGHVEQIRGNLDAAVVYYEQALEINKQLGSKEGMANGFGNLGHVEWIRGNVNDACRLWRRAYDLFAEVGARREVELVSGWMRDAACSDVP